MPLDALTVLAAASGEEVDMVLARMGMRSGRG